MSRSTCQRHASIVVVARLQERRINRLGVPPHIALSRTPKHEAAGGNPQLAAAVHIQLRNSVYLDVWHPSDLSRIRYEEHGVAVQLLGANGCLA
jgi:hypothetical protein